MSEWQPIETYIKPEFDPKHWYRHGGNILVAAPYICIAYYSYTEKGKGRFRNSLGICKPTHWMPLPEPPKK